MNSRPAAEQVLGLLNFWWLLQEAAKKFVWKLALALKFCTVISKVFIFSNKRVKAHLVFYWCGLLLEHHMQNLLSLLTVEEFTVWSLSSGQSVTASRRATLVFSLVMPRPISHLSPSSVPLVMSLDQRRVWLATKKLVESLEKKWVEHGQFN